MKRACVSLILVGVAGCEPFPEPKMVRVEESGPAEQAPMRMQKPPPAGEAPPTPAPPPGPPPPTVASPMEGAPAIPAPPRGTSHEVKPPAVQSLGRVGGGLEVVLIERHDLPLVDVRLVARAGSAADPADRPGLATFVAALLREGSQGHDRLHLAAAMEQAGGELFVETTHDATELGARVLADHLDGPLGLLAELAQSPAFPAAAVEEERKHALAELDAAERQPAFLALRATHRLVFSGTPAAHTMPSRGALAAITRDDVVRFHREHYRPDSATLILVGDVKPAQALARARKAFAAWRAPSHPPAGAATSAPAAKKESTPASAAANGAPPPSAVPAIHVVPTLPSRSAEVVIAWPAPPRGHADYLAMLLLAQIIDGALASHPIAAHLDVHRGGGLLAVEQRVPQVRTGDALGGLIALIEHLRLAPVSQTELEGARRRVIGNFLFSLDRLDGLAHLAELQRVEALPADTWIELRARLEKLTPADVQAVAARHLDPAHATVVVAADAALADALAQVAPVIRLDAEGAPVATPPAPTRP